jgi:hypothetical protein
MKIEIKTFGSIVLLTIDGIQYSCLLNSPAVAIEQAAKLGEQFTQLMLGNVPEDSLDKQLAADKDAPYG